MDLRQFESGAAASPPSAPTSPSDGYASNGNPSTGTPATIAGEYWFHQIAEELRAVLTDAALTPDDSVLTQLRDALRNLGGELPLAALQYPTIATADNRLTVTSASASNGGTVSIAAGTRLSLGEEIVSGETGRMRMFTTAAFTSPDLDVSSTYYLRAQVSAGVLSVYLQEGVDADTIPASQLGTPGGTSGGGFDSTVLDVLIARVVTGTAGSTPTVTALANASSLTTTAQLEFLSLSRSLNWNSLANSSVMLNWARMPSIAIPSLQFVGAEASLPDGADIGSGENLQMIGIRTTTISRYNTGLLQFASDNLNNDLATLRLAWVVQA